MQCLLEAGCISVILMLVSLVQCLRGQIWGPVVIRGNTVCDYHPSFFSFLVNVIFSKRLLSQKSRDSVKPNSVKHLRSSVLQSFLTAFSCFAKRSILDVSQGSTYAPEISRFYLNLTISIFTIRIFEHLIFKCLHVFS